MGEVITITGHSDDVVNIEGNGSGVDDAGEGASIVVLGANDKSANAGVRVVMRYGRGSAAIWTAEVGPVKEDMPMLVVVIGLDDNGYSPKVEIHGGVTAIVEQAVEA